LSKAADFNLLLVSTCICCCSNFATICDTRK